MNIPTSKKELLDALIHGTEKLRREIVEYLLNKSKIKANTTDSNKLVKDESIIDVTGESYKIPQPNQSQSSETVSLTIYEAGVPAWAHQYVYSFSEINKMKIIQSFV